MMIHGAFDFIPVSHAQTAADALDPASFLVLPRAPHGASFQSPLALGHCGARALFDFFDDPTAPIDTSCAEEIRPLEFEISAAAANTFFGSSDAWEGYPGDFEIMATTPSIQATLHGVSL